MLSYNGPITLRCHLHGRTPESMSFIWHWNTSGAPHIPNQSLLKQIVHMT